VMMPLTISEEESAHKIRVRRRVSCGIESASGLLSRRLEVLLAGWVSW